MWSWRGIFLVNVPIGVVLIVLAIKFIPRTSPTIVPRVDARGIVLLGLLILSAMFGIAYLGTGNTPVYSPLFLLCEGVAVTATWLFIRHAKRKPAAIVSIRLLRGRGFGVMNAINFLYGAAALGFGALVPLYAEQRYDIHPLPAGTLLTARAVGMICIAGIAVLTLRRTGYRLAMIIGFSVVAAGLVMMSVSPIATLPLVFLVPDHHGSW